MKIRAQFFAQLRDVTGVSETTLDLSEAATVAELLAKLYEQTPALRSWGKNILVGSGVNFVDRQHVLEDDEEIAIMPPVQGG